MGVFRHDKTGKDFDDGINAIPGDAEFTRDLAEAHFGDKAFSYISTPTYVPPGVIAEQAAEAERLAEQAKLDEEANALYAEQLKAAEGVDTTIAAEEVVP